MDAPFPRVTMVELPRTIRAIVLDASDDIKCNDPRVHSQLVDERVKFIAVAMSLKCMISRIAVYHET
jgi:hypothetical protein